NGGASAPSGCVGSFDPFLPVGATGRMGMLKVLRIRPARREDLLGRDPAAADDLDLLARRCRAGDASAMRTLLVSLGPPMLHGIRRVLAARPPAVEAPLQEATLALARALPTFRGACSLRHFGCRVAAFKAITARRRQRPADEPGDDAFDELPVDL